MVDLTGYTFTTEQPTYGGLLRDWVKPAVYGWNKMKELSQYVVLVGERCSGKTYNGLLLGFQYWASFPEMDGEGIVLTRTRNEWLNITDKIDAILGKGSAIPRHDSIEVRHLEKGIGSRYIRFVAGTDLMHLEGRHPEWVLWDNADMFMNPYRTLRQVTAMMPHLTVVTKSSPSFEDFLLRPSWEVHISPSLCVL